MKSKKSNRWYVIATLEIFFLGFYDLTQWPRIAEALSTDDFSGTTGVNRSQIVDHVFNLAKLRNVIDTADIGDSFLPAATNALVTAQTNIDWTEKNKLEHQRYYGIEEEVEVDENESSLPEYRISKIFRPSHYEIHLNVPKDAFSEEGTTFSGKTMIYFTVTSSTTRILLHASSDNLKIESIELNNRKIPNTDYNVNSTTDILRIEYVSGLRANTRYTLTIQYNGTFGSDNVGFYKSTYITGDRERYLLTTQFQDTHARRAFPCFDEPFFKSTFEVRITHPSEYNAWSNTPGTLLVDDKVKGLRTHEFDKTPIMSTYLLAFIVSDFTCTAGKSIGTTPYQVCSRNDEADNRAWAVEIGPKLLQSLNDFTGYKYSNAISKIDQFAIPDFEAGAMENWGLATYPEYNLLWDPAVSLNLFKQGVAAMIAHEFGHQWFGNLVTCSWWSEIFLNEGFATYIEYFTTHDVLPDWQLDKQFIVQAQQHVLSIDSHFDSQPLQSDVSTPAEISNKFGLISYLKGGSIVRMVEHIIGANAFRAGIRTYLATYKYSNTKPEQLWAALNKQVNETISRLPTDFATVMENWIKKSGFPILSVKKFRNYIVIAQKRFLLSGEDNTSGWYVPVSYTISSDENKFASTAPSTWLLPGFKNIIPYPPGSKWIVLNNFASAFYRVNYTKELWNGLTTALLAANFSEIPELNRAQIIDDVLEYANYDMMTFTQALTIVEFLENDDSYFSWYAVNRTFTTLLDNVGFNTRLGMAMKAHFVRLIDKLYNSAPANVIDEDNQLYTLKQVLAVESACTFHHQKCVSDIREHFNNFINKSIIPPKNIKYIVYCNGLRYNGTVQEWARVSAQILATPEKHRSKLNSALGCITDKKLLTAHLKYTLIQNDPFGPEKVNLYFAAVYSNPFGVDEAFNIFRENQQAIYNHCQNWTTVGNILNHIASRFRTQHEVEELRNFVTSGEILNNLLNFGNLAIATAQGKVDWVNAHRSDLYRYFGLREEETPSTFRSAHSSDEDDEESPSTSPPTESPSDPTPNGEGANSITLSLVFILVTVLISKFSFN